MLHLKVPTNIQLLFQTYVCFHIIDFIFNIFDFRYIVWCESNALPPLCIRSSSLSQSCNIFPAQKLMYRSSRHENWWWTSEENCCKYPSLLIISVVKWNRFAGKRGRVNIHGKFQCRARTFSDYGWYSGSCTWCRCPYVPFWSRSIWRFGLFRTPPVIQIIQAKSPEVFF